MRIHGLLIALAGAGLALQGCASKPPEPPPVVQAPPPPPDYSGVYAGGITYPKGCYGPKTGTLTVADKAYTMPFGKKTQFTGPVADDGSLSGSIPVAKNAKHMKGITEIDLAGKIAQPTFTGTITTGKCVGTATLTKAG